MIKLSPCKECSHRQLGCHGHCKEYRAWKDERSIRLEYVAENKYRFTVPMSARREKIYRKLYLFQ